MEQWIGLALAILDDAVAFAARNRDTGNELYQLDEFIKSSHSVPEEEVSHARPQTESGGSCCIEAEIAKAEGLRRWRQASNI
jgi:hypothetical protein